MVKKSATALAVFAGLFIVTLMLQLAMAAFPALMTGEMLKSGYWDYRGEMFSALAMIFGSGIVAAIAMVFAFPLGLGAALFLSEFLTGKLRGVTKIAVELLAGIPSVVYGLIGVAFVLPLIEPLIVAMGGVSGDSLLAAGLLLGVMILPTMVTFSDDALRCVPKKLRDEGLGLGLSKVQVIFSLVLPKAKRGIAGAGMLALGRAIGETIAIFLVIGRSDMPFSLTSFSLQSIVTAGQTLTTKLGGSEISIAYGDPGHWQFLMALGVILWIIVGTLSYASERVLGERT